MAKRTANDALTTTDRLIYQALEQFAAAVTANVSALAAGEPEAQLTNPLEAFLAAVGKALGYQHFVAKRESQLPGRLGRPDYAVLANNLLVGYVELKEPGKGASPTSFKSHDRKQWTRFKALPNLIYADGNQWALYRDGERIGRLARLSGDVTTDGKSAVTPDDLRTLKPLLTDFLAWQPIVPTRKSGQVDLKGLANLLAPICRMLRDDVTDALKDPQSPLVELARDWRQLLFPDAGDDQFADAYAQTVTFALLLARSENADPLSLDSAETALAVEHSLLSRALQVLTDPRARADIAAPLDLLVRLIGAVPTRALAGPEDPWLYFYEDFLAVYDPKLRKDAGAYYTPVEVVRAQVRLIDDLLTNRLGKPLGFADPDVVTLDPAVGTGTYLLGVIEHALAKVEAQQGRGAVPGKASDLAGNIYGFEIMTGPYAVSDLRISRAIRDRRGSLPQEGIGVYLTDTLESPYMPPRDVPYILRPIADQHRKALKLKRNRPVLVCIGNPPYDRHEAADKNNKARTGGWVRWGNDGAGVQSILREFLDPALAAGHGVHVKNLYNLYVYFWRWALWKVFEWQEGEQDEQGRDKPLRQFVHRPGVVSFISASSYLDGDAFCGMREHMRRLCDEIWILDLGGEGRGTRKTENVFAIQTPVAIAVAVRDGRVRREIPAKVHVARIDGTREQKLQALDAIANFASLTWEDCPDAWHAPFRPAGKGQYQSWPSLTNLMPWQHSGVQLKRTWPIGTDELMLNMRWRELLNATNRSHAFRGTGDREVDGTYHLSLVGDCDFTPIASLPRSAPPPPLLRYAYRSFDRQWIMADARLISRPRPPLWAAHSQRQVYLTSLLTKPLGNGPAATACAAIPDLDHFSARGAKDVIPLYRDATGSEANILPGLLDLLRGTYRRTVTPEDFAAYVYGLLAQPAFTDRFTRELSTRELRVPITKDADLFEQVRAAGAMLLWLHTYGQRFIPPGHHRGHVPRGKAKNVRPIPGEEENYPEGYRYDQASRTLHVGAGAFAPVDPEIYAFEVSGLKVVRSWLAYRMKQPKGKRSSPLDDINPTRWPSAFTTELLELLWVLEATVAGYPRQARLLEAVVEGDCFKADELPDVPDAARKPPSRQDAGLFRSLNSGADDHGKASS